MIQDTLNGLQGGDIAGASLAEWFEFILKLSTLIMPVLLAYIAKTTRDTNKTTNETHKIVNSAASELKLANDAIIKTVETKLASVEEHNRVLTERLIASTNAPPPAEPK